MKRVFLLSVFTFFLGTFLFAVSPKTYIVESVSGTVQYQTSSGSWEAVKAGMKLEGAVVIKTGLNSSVTFSVDSNDYTVKPLQKGTIEKLASTTKSSGIKIGSAAKESDVSSDQVKTQSNISTASTRASDSESDFDWEE